MILLILIAIASAGISWEICFSPIKKYLLLDKRQPALTLLTSFKAYRKLFGNWVYLLLWLVLPLILLAWLHQNILYLLFQCPFCLSFWMGVSAGLLLFGYTFPVSLLIGGLSIFLQSLHNLIRMKGV